MSQVTAGARPPGAEVAPRFDAAPPPEEPDGGRSAAGPALTAVLVAIIALATVGFAGVIVLDVLGLDVPIPPDDDMGANWTSGAVGLVFILAGASVVRVRPRHPLAWVLVVAGLVWILSALAGSWFVLAYAGAPGPGAGLAFEVVARYCAYLLVGLPLVLVLYPDGHLPRARWSRLAAVAALACTAALPTALVLVPVAELDAYQGTTTSPALVAQGIDTLSVAMPYWTPVLGTSFALLPVGVLLAFVVVVARFRRARGADRLQMRWLVWAGLVDVVVMGAGSLLPLPGLVVDITFYGAVALTASVVALALSRTRLTAVDRLLPATVVTALLALGVLAVDGLVLLVAGKVFGGRDSALVAVAVVAVLYTPLRNRLWVLARRLTRGGRDDPYGAVSTLAGRLESAAAPGEQLEALARSVAEAFRLPYVRVEIDRVDGARAVVEHGHPVTSTVELPIHYRDETIGRVALAGGRELSEADQRLLGDLLRQAAGAARAGALSASLQRARAELVAAREEERRRLRRDLHDSLGPGLGAVTLRIETARGLAPHDAAAADATLERATTEVGALLAEVRRLVHDLRPPALDELGLAGALRAQAKALEGKDLAITVEGAPGALPAAVEVAAFRIVAEALTNVVRHAGAARAEVTLVRAPQRLVVTVADDGRGIPADVAAGVGTHSVRERAAELGGRTTVSCPPAGGTVVRAELPMEDLP